MKTITLNFDGYWLEDAKEYMKAVSGVYCVYSCTYNPSKDTVSIAELLYIGEADNVHDRIANHDRLDDWKAHLSGSQTLCYSCAGVTANDRERAEAALIFRTQPPYNYEHTQNFIYEDTEIITTGKNKFLPEKFTVRKDSRL